MALVSARYWKVLVYKPSWNSGARDWAIPKLALRSANNTLLTTGGTADWVRWSYVNGWSNDTICTLRAGTLLSGWDGTASYTGYFTTNDNYVDFINNAIVGLVYATPAPISPDYLEVVIPSSYSTIGFDWQFAVQSSVNNIDWITVVRTTSFVTGFNTVCKFGLHTASVAPVQQVITFTNPSAQMPLSSRIEVKRGSGSISGIVSDSGEVIKNSPVGLYERHTFNQLARVNTDSYGGYSFDYLDTNQKFLVVASDSKLPIKPSLSWDNVQPIEMTSKLSLNDPFHAVRFNAGVGMAFEPRNRNGTKLTTMYTSAGNLHNTGSSYMNEVPLPAYGISAPLKFYNYSGVLWSHRASSPNQFTFEFGVVPPKVGERSVMFSITDNERSNRFMQGFMVELTQDKVYVRFAWSADRSLSTVRLEAMLTQGKLNQIIITYKLNDSVKMYVNSKTPQVYGMVATNTLYSWNSYNSLDFQVSNKPFNNLWAFNWGTMRGQCNNAQDNTSQGVYMPYGGGLSFFYTYNKDLDTVTIDKLVDTFNGGSADTPSNLGGYATTVYSDAPFFWHRLQETERPSTSVVVPFNGQNDPAYFGSNYTSGGVAYGQQGLTPNTTSILFNGGALRQLMGLWLELTQVTFECIIKPVELTGMIMQTSHDNDVSIFFMNLMPDGTILIAIRDSMGGYSYVNFTNASRITVNTTYHIAVVIDSENARTAKLYLNGVLADNVSLNFNRGGYHCTVFTIGGANTSTANRVSGWGGACNAYIQDVAYYNYCLSPAKVAMHAAAITT